MKKQTKILKQLKTELAPALGVTEPIAIALACAEAYRAIGGKLKKIKVITDPGVFKNSFSCAIPGTSEMGIEIAAILGVLVGEPDLKLNVLQNVKEEDVARARTLKQQGIVEIKFDKKYSGLYINTIVETNNGNGQVIIEDEHTNITYIKSNGEIKYDSSNNENENKTVHNNKACFQDYKLRDFIDFANNISYTKLKFILDAIKMNRDLALAGYHGAGMEVGSTLDKLAIKELISDDIVHHAQKLTAYAVDARMGGIKKPAMSLCGSGDHGLISTLPLIAIAEKKEMDEEKLIRSIVLSYLVTIYIKDFSGRLSAFCGCAVAAGTGASAGITYFLGGKEKEIITAIKNMAANITGIICDGGNYGCSLKAMSAAGTAVLMALFALEDTSIPDNSGIVGDSVEKTMQNMGQIASPGMLKTNDTILNIMIKES